MIRCFDILIGCNSALIRIRLHPDPDLVKIRIWPDPKIWDPVHPYYWLKEKLWNVSYKNSANYLQRWRTVCVGSCCMWLAVCVCV